MSVYYNPTTQEYPRHPGDIQLIDPEWQEGQPLPEGWVLVDFHEAPECDINEVAEPNGLELVDGVWTNKWLVRSLTTEEIEERQKALEEHEKFIQSKYI